MANPITIATTKPLNQYERQFAICDSCLWCATLLQRLDASNNNSDGFQACQLCKNKSILLIPLAKDEVYTIAIEGKRGLEIEFSKHRK